MADLPHILLVFLITFVVVFCLNVVPAFAPPTWTVITFIAIQYNANVLLLAVVGAAAATLGRMALAKLSEVIVRQKFLSDAAKQNIDHLKQELEKKGKLTFGLFLLYAFSPLPSNHVFIAYGLTALELKSIAIPFFVGRIVGYSFWAFSASSVARLLAYEQIKSGAFFSYYFLATQLLTIFTVYVFTKIDWRALFVDKKLRWRK
jgi:hypothetical protein